MSNQIYIGIDGGLNGALCAIQNGKILDKIVMPTIKISKSKRDYDILEIIKFLKKFKNPFVCLEKAQPMPTPGVVQMFHFGRGYGIIIGILSALGYQYQIVHAKRWQNFVFKDVDRSDTKAASVLIAKRLFPNNDFRATERSRKQHDGLTDASLICFYGSKNY